MFNEREMRKQFSKEMEVYNNHSVVNPLEVFEDYYFEKSKTNMNYRDESFKRCIQERLDFEMTGNNQRNVMNKLITINCPECNNKMEHVMVNRYECICGNVVQIALSSLGVEFSKKKWFEIKALNPCDGENDEITIILIVANYKKDMNSQVIAEVVKYRNEILGNEQVKVRYLNERAKGDNDADKVINNARRRLLDTINE